MRLLRRAGFSVLQRAVRRAFRKVEWVGPWQPPPTDRPVILYANHHLFYDSYILGLLAERLLGRRAAVWMEELDRFPFLGALGALPLPAADGRRRVGTIRRTARLMRDDPALMLVYFPEGRLHPATDGVLPFPAERMRRLDAVLPRGKLWWPVALTLADLHRHRPTVRVTAGEPHAVADGGEHARLSALLAGLESSGPGNAIMQGDRGPDERWSPSRWNAS